MVVLLQFEFSEGQIAFRNDLRSFLEKELVGVNVSSGYHPDFSRRLAAGGWIGAAWPREYGGQELSSIEQMIYTEEMIRYKAPRGYHFIGERQVGPSLIRHGTEEQKKDWLARIRNAEVSFALGLSEPGAGSDLAAVATRAIRDGDEYVVTGQKIWTSNAHNADVLWLVTRTDANAPKHRGISCLMVDIASPGIDIRPLLDMAGRHHFNEVYFDQVRVPVSRRVGEENAGWYILAEHLDFERSGIERLVELEQHFLEGVAVARDLSAHGHLSDALRTTIANLAIELQVGRLLCYRVAWMQSTGRMPNAEASLSKLFGTEWSQRVARVVHSIMGMSANAFRPNSPGDNAAETYLSSVPRTIAGGTSEIQRNIIALRGLGLPR